MNSRYRYQPARLAQSVERVTLRMTLVIWGISRSRVRASHWANFFGGGKTLFCECGDKPISLKPDDILLSIIGVF